MDWTIIAVLIIVGFLFLLLEILVLPGTNIAGILGFVMIGLGVWQAYAMHGAISGTITLGATVILSLFALYFALKSKTWKKATLKKEINSRVNVIDEQRIKVGDTGIAISRINPMGKAMINGEYYEVKSTGEFIDDNTELEIIKIDHNKITVKPKKT
ncbi:MAG: NfeD family protein [Bacteroidetes bacterium]|nr:NfeD family protein [Bacteroidota bacterium]MBL7104099.1 NfeD family protein [Bacteroidales bacterium]